MKILILGAKGMLGQALARVFVDLNPILWDKDDIELTDFSDTHYKLLTTNCDVIINAAAFTDVDGAEENSEIAYKLNGESVKNLAKIADELDATLIQYSTAYIFDGKNPNGYKEDDEPNPQSVYAKSKLEGERGAAKAHKHYILRIDRLFGKSGAGKKSFVDLMLDLSISKKEIRGIADEYGCPTYAPDLAKRTREILEKKPPFGVYHCANEGSCSWHEWAEEIFKIKGIDIELKQARASDFSRKAVRPKYGILQNTKLPKTRTWQEALRDYLK